jgi:diguanylate cyclase (GGDEF)-like protein
MSGQLRSPRLRLGMRLTRTAIGAVAIALLIAGSVLNGGMFLLARGALLADSRALAGVIAGNLSAPLMFRDENAARETLATLDASPEFIRAVLRDGGGRTFAQYGRGPAGVAAQRAGAPATGHRLAERELIVWHPVQLHGRPLGGVEIALSLEPLYRQTLMFGGITLLAALGALGIAFLLALGVRRDIDRVELQLDELAYVDPVTGLANRHAAREQLRNAVRQARLAGGAFTLVLLDLDDFKVVNDTLGHPVGDEVLRGLAQRLHHWLPRHASAFRFGGDEFIVVAGDVGREAFDARAVVAALSAPLRVDSQEVCVRCSAGTARFPADGVDEDELLRAADAAMYHAKSLGKNGFAAYRPELRAASRQRLRVETELRRAVAARELQLHYQPIVELASGEIVGAEALLRWLHPTRGLLAAEEFIDVAEASGLVVEIGGWVLDEAAHQLERWQLEGLDGFFVAVNASARQLRGGELLLQVERALARSGCPPERLEIEITEHTLVEDAQHNVQALLALRERGLKVTIDDFGTGLSSLAYLRRLPVDKFKIDRSFVRELPATRGDLAIVRAVVSMARALDLRVVAEGVETEAQRDLLLRMGCDCAQGWWFGRPVAPELFAAALRARKPLTAPVG